MEQLTAAGNEAPNELDSSLFYLQDPAKLAATKPAVASEGTGPGGAEPPRRQKRTILMQLGFSLFLIAIASLVVWSVVHKLSRSTVPAVGAPSGRPQSPAAFVAIGGRLSATAGDDFAWQLPQAA